MLLAVVVAFVYVEVSIMRRLEPIVESSSTVPGASGMFMLCAPVATGIAIDTLPPKSVLTIVSWGVQMFVLEKPVGPLPAVFVCD